MAYRVPREIDRRLTNKLKADIRSKDLIDTWALYTSIQVAANIGTSDVFMSANVPVDIRIWSEPYIVYLNERFSITDDFAFSQSVENTLDIMQDSYRKWHKRKYPTLDADRIFLYLRDIYFMVTPDDGAPQQFSYNLR
jgi:hypothetical protein